jgi:hypothetical protein
MALSYEAVKLLNSYFINSSLFLEIASPNPLFSFLSSFFPIDIFDISTFAVSKPALFYVIVFVSSYNNSQADIHIL